jgi:hypothetical protein
MAPREHDRVRFEGIVTSGGAPETNSASLARPSAAWLDVPAANMQRTGWTYLSHAAIHPSNLLLLIGVMFLSLILWSTPVLIAGMGVEMAFLAVVPRCAFFRRRIDEYLDEVDRANAQKAREALILQMSEAHRQELCKIESLIGKSLANARRHNAASPFVVCEPLGLGRLTGSYIRLAIAHRACEESLAMTNRHLLEGTIRSLESAEGTAHPRVRTLLRRRLSIAYRRVECWTRTRDNLEAIGHQLATIAELVLLLHQESLAPAGPSTISAEVDRILADFEHGEGALRELAELGVVEDAIEVQELCAAESALIARRA